MLGELSSEICNLCFLTELAVLAKTYAPDVNIDSATMSAGPDAYAACRIPHTFRQHAAHRRRSQAYDYASCHASRLLRES